MTFGVSRGDAIKPKSVMDPVMSFKCEGRCCCVAGHAVWVAELKGGIAVCDSQSGEVLTRVAIGGGGNPNDRVQFKSMVLVHDEIWAGNISGTVHIFDVPTRQWKHSMRILGVEATAPIMSLCFDGLSVLGGSETGRVVQWNPFTKEQVNVFVALAPVTAVTVVSGFVVCGDRNGAVQFWDPRSGEVIYEHTKDTSSVTSLLAELATSTLWVGRRNGTVSVYTLSSMMNFTCRLSVGEGAVTSMLAVSGKVLVTTYDRSVVVFAAATREELNRVKTAHDAFIHYSTRVYAAETARIWTIGNDGVIHVWNMAGYFLPCQSSPNITPYDQAAMVHGARGVLTAENAELSTRIAESCGRIVDVKEELRIVRDEAHEARLRLISFEHVIEEKEREITSRTARIKELEEDVKRLQKDVTDTNARSDTVQREISMLRKDYNAAVQDVSLTRSQLSAKIAEKADVEQQLSTLRTERSHVDIRIRDADSQIAQLKTENARLHGALEQLSSSQTADREAYQKMLANTEGSLRRELDELRNRNQLLGSLLASMHYTIRRKEEEERDMTALMNTYRRKVAERVTDPHLAALLNATVMRNPDRFDMECDEHTKSILCERNGPFVHFLQMLRDRDPSSYAHLLEYLQHPDAGSQFNPIFDRLFILAQKEGSLSDDDIVSFKKTLPVLLNSLNGTKSSTFRGGEGGEGGSNKVDSTPGTGKGNTSSSLFPASASTNAKQNMDASVGSTGAVGATGSGSGGATATFSGETAFRPPQQEQKQTTQGASESGKGLLMNDDFKTFLRSMNITIEPPDGVGQVSTVGLGEDGYLKQLRSTFEFILQTRRDLVDQLGILHKRIVKARQVVDALTSNARESLSPYRRLSGSLGTGAGANGGGSRRESLGSVSVNILEELQRFVSSIVAVYFTAAEKQRLGLSA